MYPGKGFHLLSKWLEFRQKIIGYYKDNNINEHWKAQLLLVKNCTNIGKFNISCYLIPKHRIVCIYFVIHFFCTNTNHFYTRFFDKANTIPFICIINIK